MLDTLALLVASAATEADWRGGDGVLGGAEEKLLEPEGKAAPLRLLELTVALGTERLSRRGKADAGLCTALPA